MSEAIANAASVIQQKATLEDSLGQSLTQDDINYFGASSTLSDGSGKIRTGAYLYVPVVQADGSTVYEKKSADEALKLKNVANMVPGLSVTLRNTSTPLLVNMPQLQRAWGQTIGKNIGRVAGAVVTPGGAIAKAGGVRLAESLEI